ncbi:MAG: hypothetical protein ACRDP7_50380, partial [Trebonia sp.]
MDPAPGGFDRGLAAARGIAAVAGLIARTLGPAGRPALVRDQTGRDTEAPDAETIAACFTSGHPGDDLGAEYVRDLVRDQHAAVPDGAATAVVLAEAFDKVGKDGVITVEPAAEPGLELSLSQGMSVDGGYASA